MKDVLVPTNTKEFMAYLIVKLYFEEIARLGFKRKVDLDSVVNAYFYVLERLEDREKMKEIGKKEENLDYERPLSTTE